MINLKLVNAYQICTINLTILLLVFFRSSFAEVACTKPSRANDILKCLQAKHPEVLEEKTINEVSERLAGQGNAWKNPEISFETIGGQSLGSSLFDSELKVSQTIEFSGRRSAKKKLAQAKGDFFKAEGLQKIEEITLGGAISLYRLVQLAEESEKINESLNKFKTIKSQYQSRIKLSPEQEVTLGMIQLAISEFEIKLNRLLTEKHQTIADLTANTGYSKIEIETNLPKNITNWPTLNLEKTNIQSGIIQRLKAELDLSKGELDLARAEAWPEFTVDLILQNKIDGSIQYQMYGVGITLPLPIYQQNQGEKKLKAVEFFRNQNIYSAQVRKQDTLTQNLFQTYDDAVRNLKNTPSVQSIENKHKRTEQLFSQGLISGPLIIEAHRQILEYTESRNMEELRALEALWRIYISKGNFLNQEI